MRLDGIEVNEQPKFMTRNPTTKHHSVYFEENNIILPLEIKGIVSFILTRKPTQEEYLNIGKRLKLKPPFTEWDTHNPSYGIRKKCMLDHDGIINSKMNTPTSHVPIAGFSTVESSGVFILLLMIPSWSNIHFFLMP